MYNVHECGCIILTSEGLKIVEGTKCLTRRISLDMNCMSPLQRSTYNVKALRYHYITPGPHACTKG